jgi:hypothetical protein
VFQSERRDPKALLPASKDRREHLYDNPDERISQKSAFASQQIKKNGETGLEKLRLNPIKSKLKRNVEKR